MYLFPKKNTGLIFANYLVQKLTSYFIHMPTIHLTTFIGAPVERVFDLARSIDLHKQSMKKHNEEAVAGTRFGLIEKNETVTWKAKHLFKTRFLRSEITKMVKPQVFVDEQVEGDFKMLRHEYYFMIKNSPQHPRQIATLRCNWYSFMLSHLVWQHAGMD